MGWHGPFEGAEAPEFSSTRVSRMRWARRTSSGPSRRGSDRVREDADPFDLDLHPVPRSQVPGLLALLELAAAWDCTASPHLSRVDRLEARQAFDHLGERPQRPVPLLHEGVLIDELAVPATEPLLSVHAYRDALVLQLANLVPRDDAGSEGVRPVLSGCGAHADPSRGHLDVPGGEVVENRDAEQVRRRVLRGDLRAPEPKDESHLGLVVELLRGDPARSATFEDLVPHRRDCIPRADHVQVIPVVVRGHHVPFRGYGTP